MQSGAPYQVDVLPIPIKVACRSSFDNSLLLYSFAFKVQFYQIVDSEYTLQHVQIDNVLYLYPYEIQHEIDHPKNSTLPSNETRRVSAFLLVSDLISLLCVNVSNLKSFNALTAAG